VAVAGAFVLFLLPGPCEARDRSGSAPAAGSPAVLARVVPGPRLADVPFPVHVRLTGADGVTYALVFAAPERLALVSGTTVLASGASPREFVVARARRPGARARAAGLAEVLLDDGRYVVARANEAQAEALAAAGFDLLRLPAAPMAVPRAPAPAARAAPSWDARVASLVAGITEAAVSDLVAELSGEREVTVGSAPTTLATRHTYSGTPIAQATQLARERFLSFGLAASFHEWGGAAGPRNVVAERTGSVRPGEVVLVCAHLDDMPVGGLAPGADDNASGAATVLLAARALAGTSFERTVRFALFTGEEQGLYGSQAYAQELAAQGTDVVAVLNLDMVGWNSPGTSPTLRLHTRPVFHPGYAADLAIAETFRSAVDLYVDGGTLVPLDDPDGEPASDHFSFWSRGWPAVLAIEDDASDFNPHYHTTGDTLARLDLAYLTGFAKAAAATAALLAGPAARASLFHPLVPCRLLDTRDTGRPDGFGPPALAGGEARAFAAGTACGIPEDATALAVNVTVVEPLASGFLTLYPGSGPPPGTSNVAFGAGRNRAAMSVLPVGPGVSFGVLNSSPGSAHLVVDVVGAFR